MRVTRHSSYWSIRDTAGYGIKSGYNPDMFGVRSGLRVKTEPSIDAEYDKKAGLREKIKSMKLRW